MKYLVLLVVLASSLPLAATAAQDADDLKPYPAGNEVKPADPEWGR